MEPRDESSFEKETPICTSLPTICENAKDDKRIQVGAKELRRCRKLSSNSLMQANSLSLPPLIKDIESCKYENNLPNLKRRPSTPRPILLVREKQRGWTGGVGSHRLSTEMPDANSKHTHEKEEDEEDFHPLFSVSPNYSERSSPETEVVNACPVTFQSTNSISIDGCRPLLRRGRVKSCDLHQLPGRACFANIPSRKLSRWADCMCNIKLATSVCHICALTSIRFKAHSAFPIPLYFYQNGVVDPAQKHGNVSLGIFLAHSINFSSFWCTVYRLACQVCDMSCPPHLRHCNPVLLVII